MSRSLFGLSVLFTVGVAAGLTACSSEPDPLDPGAGGSSDASTSAGSTSGPGATSGGGAGGSAATSTTASTTASTGSPSGTGGDSAGAGGSGGAGDGGSGGAGAGGSGGAGDSGSMGCGEAVTRPDPRQQQTLTVGGVTRYYLIHVPENYDPSKPLPLVFGIHGLNMNNVWAAHDNSGFQLIQETNNQALLIYPQGLPADGQSRPPSTQSQWGTADSNWGGPPPNANQARMTADLAFFDAMLEHAKANYCVDTKRVFAVGFSQGGFMTNTLGCQRSSVFRGLAPVAGWGPQGSQPTCSDASAAHAVIQTQGDTDGTVTPALGQATRDFWRGRNGCQATTMPSASGDGCVEYQGCKEGLPLVYCTHPGGHSVPSGAGGRAWRFFQSLK
ncbi:alpha/beta hydrolase family esterase [Sorangium sp. So ce590]|uniref:alpha/beta hydrolase family esterase n=1 Tax=unclassified Sorangium TaxID=2621164 RepID=UPI003F5DC186